MVLALSYSPGLTSGVGAGPLGGLGHSGQEWTVFVFVCFLFFVFCFLFFVFCFLFFVFCFLFFVFCFLFFVFLFFGCPEAIDLLGQHCRDWTVRKAVGKG